jgi:hypothetical protein
MVSEHAYPPLTSLDASGVKTPPNSCGDALPSFPFKDGHQGLPQLQRAALPEATPWRGGHADRAKVGDIQELPHSLASSSTPSQTPLLDIVHSDLP